MKSTASDIIDQNKSFGLAALGTLSILFIPLVAMQFTDEVNWGLSDFVIMALMLFGISSLFILVARRIHTKRLVIGIIFALLMIYIWAELAVGIFSTIGS